MADAVAADDCYYTAMMSMSMPMLMRSKHDYSLIISEYFNVAIVINAFFLSLCTLDLLLFLLHWVLLTPRDKRMFYLIW